ncbi:MAG: hypothetical protein Q4G38_01345 [Aeriscardovia aeriphila]|nr:hypothetical protein [Aeriscardovia aeriphila]
MKKDELQHLIYQVMTVDSNDDTSVQLAWDALARGIVDGYEVARDYLLTQASFAEIEAVGEVFTDVLAQATSTETKQQFVQLFSQAVERAEHLDPNEVQWLKDSLSFSMKENGLSEEGI